DEAADYFRTFSKRYDFTYKIKISSNISAAAMVINSSQTLVLNKSHKFSQHQLNVLCNHEIGVHMVTTFNALVQPLKIFSNGFPNNVQTQEGLAVYSEFMSGNLSIDRLKELSYRVLAVDSLNKGYSFSDTFDLLYSQYKLDKNKAFIITQRVHRGGGFTKDHLYLSGLIKIYNYAKSNKDLQPFLMGKVAMEYESVLNVLLNKGLAVKPLYITDSYTLELEKEPTVKFILDSLD
ncbi:MAG: flavohemoglobin expression-modulating QEGLA motif protein, partial [Winogradskyella sp.]|nr:flavohemoglobin expression-modulating QEGLA motif protein [Winogradskyella sp.]